MLELETLSDLQAVGALSQRTLGDFELQHLSPSG
ncbi:hypothetical protein Thiowin_04546 [Thiorhodovibrio winogradskyi]|uniref:Uncharacterized protein n=1 Tax=Thiorhodovibrio winogradskyi TaxID=77007 RepID=A0ABZ0SGB0_9GAMM